MRENYKLLMFLAELILMPVWMYNKSNSVWIYSSILIRKSQRSSVKCKNQDKNLMMSNKNK